MGVGQPCSAYMVFSVFKAFCESITPAKQLHRALACFHPQHKQDVRMLIMPR
uniref:Uncharacterized protein n=1 Tax=Arundo donax TaxID=35708 RepID=A0A0A9G295_ARUDO